jgi:RNA polymerase sigma-70 factor (ECF subfamily)
MSVSDSSVGGEAGQFHTTRWSLVLASARDQSQTGRAALAALCKIYWYPLYAFARRRGHSPHDSQDLTQGFFLHILEHRALSGVNRLKGKFRSFLLPAFRTIFRLRRAEPTDSSEGGSVSLFPWTWNLPKIVIDTSRRII